MIAKIVAHAPTRGEALDRLAAALRGTVVVGPRVNTPFLAALAEHGEFRAGRFDTGFIARHLAELLRADAGIEAQAIDRAVAVLLERERARIADGMPSSPVAPGWRDPWSANDGFSLGPPRTIAVDILVDGAARQASVTWGAGGAQVTVDGAGVGGDAAPASASVRVVAVADGAIVIASGRQHHVALMRHDTLDAGHLGDDGIVRAPMNGKIVDVFVVPGQKVKRGARLALMEAMKMEHSLTAPTDGTVAEVATAAGAQAVAGAALVRIAADAVKA
jgi:3-methylcrotonyl-CoA carboxylase alpha subunit